MVKFSNKMTGVFTIAEIGLNHNGNLKSALHFGGKELRM